MEFSRRFNVSRRPFRTFTSAAFLIFCSLVFASLVAAQAPPAAWSAAFGSTVNDKGYAVAADANGNTYVTGFFNGTVTVGSSITCPSYSSGCVFLAKFAPNGIAQWAKSFNNDYGSGSALATDSSGNVILAGSFADADFGCGAGTQSGSIFAAKFGPDGSCMWAKPFASVATAGTGNSGGNDLLNGLAIDSSGNVLLAGKFGCSTNQGCAINLGGGLIASGQQPSYGGIFVAKLSGTNGAWQWANAYGGVSG